MPTDPVLASARYLVGESLKELRSSIEGLPVEALNWRPAGDATNSIAVLATAEEVDWTAMRKTHGRGGDASPEVTAAYALVHATEHLRGHVDQSGLTRQLWEQRPAP